MSLKSACLSFLCTIHHVTIGVITNNQNYMHTSNQQYTINVYVSKNESLLLQCLPVSLSHGLTPEQHQPLPEMTINIASQSDVRLEHSSSLIIPQLNDESLLLNCSSSDPQEFTTLQDMLTHFTKFENRQHIRNTLAMVSPSSYQVTRLVAENVSFDHGAPCEKNAFTMDEDDDFIATRENYYGQKLPVMMDDNVFKDRLELRKVRLINKTSQCMEASSEWLARGMISAGDSIAGYIQSGESKLEENSSKTQASYQLVASKQRAYFDIVFNITKMIGNMAADWFSKLLHLTAVKEATAAFVTSTPKSQLGNSAFQAANRVMEGSLVAAGTVLSASRQGLVQAIEKKYGVDASYMAGKIMGSDQLDKDVMVYFDNHGISRKVVVQQPHPANIHQSSITNESSTSFVVHDEEVLNTDRQVVYDTEEQDYITKKPEKLVLV